MAVQSQRALIEARLNEAIPLALRGAAQIYRTAMMESLRNPPEGGYTSGAWDHGMAGVAGSVAVSPVEQDEQGHRIAVGTNVECAKHWELGHVNLFTRRFERVERWRPVLDREAPAMVERFWTLLRRLMR